MTFYRYANLIEILLNLINVNICLRYVINILEYNNL